MSASSKSANAASNVGYRSLHEMMCHIGAPLRIYSARDRCPFRPTDFRTFTMAALKSRNSLSSGSCANCWMSDAWQYTLSFPAVGVFGGSRG